MNPREQYKKDTGFRYEYDTLSTNFLNTSDSKKFETIEDDFISSDLYGIPTPEYVEWLEEQYKNLTK